MLYSLEIFWIAAIIALIAVFLSRLFRRPAVANVPSAGKMRFQWPLLIVPLSVVLLLAAGAGLELGMSAIPREDPLGRHLLYMPTAEYLKILSMGNEGLMADYLYLWAIQYYSQFKPNEQYFYLDKIFNQITDLDPHFKDAYLIGAVMMLIERERDPEARKESVLALLEKGIKANPEDSSLAEEAAWKCYIFFKDREKAEAFIRVALSRPNVSHRARRFLGRLLEERWTLKESIDYWQQVLDEAGSDFQKSVSRNSLYDLLVARDRQVFEPYLKAFKIIRGRPAVGWRELIEMFRLPEALKDPVGVEYKIDRDGETIVAEKNLELIKTTEFHYPYTASRLDELQARGDGLWLNALLRNYRNRTGRCPDGWQQLIDAGALKEIPLDPDEKAYGIDRETCMIEAKSD
jgi:hypothetical protein